MVDRRDLNMKIEMSKAFVLCFYGQDSAFLIVDMNIW